MTDRSVTVSLALNIRDYVNSGEEVVKANEKITSSLGETGEKGKQDLETVGDAAGVVGAAMTGLGAITAFVSMEFDKQMSAVAAAANASGESLNQLREAAINAGNATVFSATQAAQAETELAKAGISTSDILSGALKGSLDLAAAGQLDLAKASEIASDVMNIWSLKGSDVAHVADVITAAANKSSTDVKLMGDSIQQAGLVAQQAGLSLEETSGILAAFAQSGLKGSDAGTSLKTMMLRLISPTQETTTKLDALGIKLYDAEGHFVGASKLAGQLQTALSGLDEESRNAALGTIFGSDAIRAANVLYKEGYAGIERWIKSVDDQGIAARTAGKLTNNLAGDLEKLKGSLETLTIKSGEGVTSFLRALAQHAAGAVSSFSGLPGWLQSTIALLISFGGVSLLAVSGFIKIRASVLATTQALAAMGTAGAVASKSILFTAGIGKWFLGAMLAANATNIAISSFSKQTSANMGQLTKDLAKFGESGKASGEAAIMFGKNMNMLKHDIASFDTGSWQRAGMAVTDFFEGFFGQSQREASLAKARERMQQLDGALAQLVQSGNMAQAKNAFFELSKVAKEQGVSTEELTKGLPQYRAALAGATQAQTDQISVAEKQKAATDKVAAGFEAAIKAAQSFKTALESFNGAAATVASTEIAVEEALAKVTEAVKENGDTLNINTAAGRANKTAILDVRQAAIEAAQAKYDESRATKSESDAAADAANVYNTYINRLREAAKSAGLNKDQVDLLVQSIAGMPPFKATQVQTPGLPEAQAQVQNYNNNLRSIPNLVSSTVRVKYEEWRDTHGQRWGGVVEHAQTGLLREAGIFKGGPLYAFAEPATGGEAFIPKNGDPDRSLAILQKAASWYGQTVGPPMAMVAGGAREITLRLIHQDRNGRTLHEELIKYAADRGRTPASLWPASL